MLLGQPSPLVPLEPRERERLQQFLVDGAPTLERVCLPYPWDLDGRTVTWRELVSLSGLSRAELARDVAELGRVFWFGPHPPAVLTQVGSDRSPAEPWLRRLAMVLVGDPRTSDDIVWCPWNVVHYLSFPRPTVPHVAVPGGMGVDCYRVPTDVFMEDFRAMRQWAPAEGVWAAPDLTWLAVHEPGLWGATIACCQRVAEQLRRDEAFDVVAASSLPERDVLTRITEAA